MPVKDATVRLATIVAMNKDAGEVAAAAADALRTQAVINPTSAAASRLAPDEFERAKAISAQFAQAKGQAPAQAQISRIWTASDKGGLPRMRWHGPGDTETFFMEVKISKGDAAAVVPQLWTNLNHSVNPSDFEAYPMQLVSKNGDTAVYQTTIPVQRQGDFRVTGRISANGQPATPAWQWANDVGVGDIRFRPHAVGLDDISEMVVNVGLANASPDGSTISTFRDLMDPTKGKYNIQAIKAAGKNTIRLQPPFRHDRWAGVSPVDSLGSPYATTDYFTIDPRYSRDAQQALASGRVQPWDTDALRTIANAEFWQFVQAARDQGVEVILDIALNHMGHQPTIRDLFDDPVAGERVIRNNFDQITVNAAQTQAVHDRLKTNPYGTGEQLFPEMFANKNHDPSGAQSTADLIGGGNGEWADTIQLNSGAFNWGGEIHDTTINRSVTDYMTRVLKYWAAPPAGEPGVPTDGRGVEGFRLDHSTNLPPELWERSITQLQAMVDHPLALVMEDFNQQERLRVYGDAMESGWYKELIADFKNGDPDGIWSIVGSDYFYETLRGGNHDEERISTQFGGNLLASGRYLAMLDLFGGISTTVMGDEFGEAQKLGFKTVGAVPPVLVEARDDALPQAQLDVQQAMRRAGDAKQTDPSLKTALRTRLNPAGPTSILGVARHADDRAVPGTMVFCNLANDDRQTNKFMLDDETRARIDPRAWYQASDLMSADPSQGAWPTRRSGQDLLDNGVYVSLAPYQIQALKLEKQG